MFYRVVTVDQVWTQLGRSQFHLGYTHNDALKQPWEDLYVLSVCLGSCL